MCRVNGFGALIGDFPRVTVYPGRGAAQKAHRARAMAPGAARGTPGIVTNTGTLEVPVLRRITALRLCCATAGTQGPGTMISTADDYALVSRGVVQEQPMAA